MVEIYGYIALMLDITWLLMAGWTVSYRPFPESRRYEKTSADMLLMMGQICHLNLNPLRSSRDEEAVKRLPNTVDGASALVIHNGKNLGYYFTLDGPGWT